VVVLEAIVKIASCLGRERRVVKRKRQNEDSEKKKEGRRN
jgi:hypothetical protein